MAKPENIVEHHVDEDEDYKHEWDITWTPIRRWTFDQFGSDDGSWSSDGTITLWESDDYNYRLIIKTWRGEYVHSTYRDQWGTYYYGEGEFYIASEEGTRSFWIAYLEALKVFSDAAEFRMAEPDREIYDQTWRENNPRQP